MKKLLIICLVSALFSVMKLHAQKVDSLKINAIPRGMVWENQPVTATAGNDQISITAGPKTDMFRDPNVKYNTDNAPKLLFRADDNFVLSAAIEHAFTNKWDAGALVVKQDNMNWIKFAFERDYTGAKRVVTVVTRNISDDANSVVVTGTKVYFKIAKADNVFTLYYSNDGATWFLVRHFQMTLKKGFRIGFLAQSPTGEQCEVKFSDIRYSKTKIKDPYAGE